MVEPEHATTGVSVVGDAAVGILVKQEMSIVRLRAFVRRKSIEITFHIQATFRDLRDQDRCFNRSEGDDRRRFKGFCGSRSTRMQPQYNIGSVADNSIVLQGENLSYIATADAIPKSLRQIPSPPNPFVGRLQEIDSIVRTLSESRGKRPGIVAIAGMPGVGKSGLAIVAAFQLQELFPDAQLYIDLRGHEAGSMDPEDALRIALRSLGVVDNLLPQSLGELAALYRSQCSTLKVMVVLDNAESVDQIKLLLPGGKNSATIVTSRRVLQSIHSDLDILLLPLSDTESQRLLAEIARREPEAQSNELISEIAKYSGNLPLALRILGPRIRNVPEWTLESLLFGLREENTRLSALEDNEKTFRLSFDLSYSNLQKDEAIALQKLAIAPWPWLYDVMATGLLGLEMNETSKLLESLADAQLLRRAARDGTYVMHDLIRLVAQKQLQEMTDQDRRVAIASYFRFLYGALSLCARTLLPKVSGSQSNNDRASGDEEASISKTMPTDSARWLFELIRANFSTDVQLFKGVGLSNVLIYYSPTVAKLLERNPDPSELRSVYNELRAAGYDANDQQAITIADIGIRRSLRMAGDPAGVDNLLETLRGFSNEDSPELRAECMLEVGLSFLQVGCVDDSEEILLECKHLLNIFPDADLTLQTSDSLAACYYKQHRPGAAAKELGNAIIAAQTSGGCSKASLGRSLLHFGFLGRRQNSAGIAKILQSAYSLLLEGGRLLEATIALHQIALVDLQVGDTEKGMKILDIVVESYQNLGYSFGLAQALRHRAQLTRQPRRLRKRDMRYAEELASIESSVAARGASDPWDDLLAL